MAQLAILIGGGLTATAQIQQGRVAEAQGKFSKEIAVRNQQALERQRIAELEAAEIEEARVSRKEKIVKGIQRAVIGKSGVGLAGSTLSLLADTAAQFSMERSLTLRRGMLRGRELRERGQIQLAQGRWARTLGRQAKRLSYVKAGATILGAAGMAGMGGGGGTTSAGSAPGSWGAGSAGQYGQNFPSGSYR